MKTLSNKSKRNKRTRLVFGVLVLMGGVCLASSCEYSLAAEKTFGAEKDHLEITTWELLGEPEPDVGVDEVDRLIANFSGGATTKFQQTLDYVSFDAVAPTFIQGDSMNYVVKTEVYASMARKAILMMGTTGKPRVFANGQPLSQLVDRKELEKYGVYYELPLRAGINSLSVVLSFAGDQRKKLLGAIANEETALDVFHQQYWSDFLAHSILEKGQQLTVQLPVIDPGTDCTVALYQTKKAIDVQIATTGKGKITIGTDHLPTGVYTLKLKVGKHTFRQPFLIGSPNEEWEKLMRETNKANGHLAYEALRQRGTYLLNHRPHEGQRQAYFNVEVSTNGQEWKSVFEGKSTTTALGQQPLSIGERARLLKITGQGNSFHDWNAISELNAYTQTDGGNEPEELVIRTIRASRSDAEHHAAHVYDRNPETSWESKGVGEWLLLDFEKQVGIHSLDIAWKKSEGSKKKIENWDRKLGYVFQELAQLSRTTDSVGEGKVPAGRHVYGYRSATDGQVRHYIVQLPEGYQPDQKYPLVVHVLPRIATPVEIVNSYLMADTKELDQSQLAIDRLGIIEVWTFADSFEAYLDEKGFAAYDQVLQDVSDRHKVDPDRVWLYATCSGFIKAIQLAQKWPDRFAAIAAAPMFFADDEQLKLREKLHLLQEIPIFLHHSEDDGVTPIENLKIFLEIAEEHGLQTEAVILKHTTRPFYASEQYAPLYEKLAGLSAKTRDASM